MREKKMKISFSRKRNFRVKRKSEVSAIENRVLKKTVNSNESRKEKPKKNACRIRPAGMKFRRFLRFPFHPVSFQLELICSDRSDWDFRSGD